MCVCGCIYKKNPTNSKESNGWYKRATKEDLKILQAWKTQRENKNTESKGER